MSATVLKPFQHVFSIFKTYLAFGLLGALAMFVYGAFVSYPNLGASLMAMAVVIYCSTKMTRRVIGLRDRPPTYAKLILYWYLPPKDRDQIVGDLEEMYFRVESRVGPRPAHLMYWKEVLISIWYLVRWRIRYGLDLSADISNLRERLPFYRLHKKSTS